MSARPRWAFLTFGAGLPNWRAAARRLERDAKASGWFDVSLSLDERDLARMFPDFTREHEEILKFRVKGFGYWLWKPFLIRELTAQLGSGYDGIVYLDSGCQLNPNGRRARQRMSDYLAVASDQGLFAVHLPDHPEKDWSRKVVMEHFGLSTEQRELSQIQGGIIAVTRKSLDIIDEWFESAATDDYRLLVDAPTGELNAPTFKAHRHDQAIFSAIVKSRGLEAIPDETYWSPNWIRDGADYPIWAPRNRTRVPVQASDWRSRMVAVSEKAYSRGLNEVFRILDRKGNL